MNKNIDLDSIFTSSNDVLITESDGGLILLPLGLGIADFEDGVFSLNKMGSQIWNQFDGKRTVKKIIENIKREYDVPLGELRKNVIALVKELIDGRMLIEKRKK